MALIISARNLMEGDTFACLTGDVTRYTVVGPIRPAQLTRGYDDTVGVVVPVGHDEAAILLGGSRPVRLYGPARPVRPLRANLAPRLSALVESTPSTAWEPTATAFRGAGYSIGTIDRWPANGDECHGLTGYVALMADADGRRRPVA